MTSVVGEIETIRVCGRGSVPPEQVEELRDGLVVVALDDEVRRLAAVVGPPLLRTLDAIHLATALSLREDLDGLVAYDARLARAAAGAGLPVLAPS